MLLLDGKALAKKKQAELKSKINIRLAEGKRAPSLAVVLVGNDPASEVYVAHKEKACKAVGIHSQCLRLPASTTEKQVIEAVQRFNADADIDGILVQLPLPKGIDAHAVINSIAAEKDVDGLTAESQGLLLQGRPQFMPCTPMGIIDLLKENRIELKGKKVAIIGRSNLVGLPLMRLVLAEDATPIVLHTKSKNPQELTKLCDIVIVAAGRPGLVTADWVSQGAVVVDVGIHRSAQGLVGDVDFASVSLRCSAITPVPGGVGPMTIASLLANCLKAASH